MAECGRLPAGVTVIERGWLSANNIVFTGEAGTAVVDTGYVTHAAQTVGLIQQVLGIQPLDLVLNTHLHSDHCGGNAELQKRYPDCTTLIPPGHANQVRAWDEVALTYVPTGQSCPRFRFEDVLRPGESIALGRAQWQIHAAPGHDTHSVILFEPVSRTLVSADALWENGFGVVFPEVEGEEGFNEVADTLALIESLDPLVVIPGHGAVFFDVDRALSVSRSRLEKFVRHPDRHAIHAAKVLLKYKLLEWQRVERELLLKWAEQTSYIGLLHERYFSSMQKQEWLCILLDELASSGALRYEGPWVFND